MNFKEELEKRKSELEEILEKYLPAEEGFCKELAQAMNYSMRAGGKRLRPLLMAETYKMFGGTSQIIQPFLAAIEMIHTYSLIHDDRKILRLAEPLAYSPVKRGFAECWEGRVWM